MVLHPRPTASGLGTPLFSEHLIKTDTSKKSVDTKLFSDPKSSINESSSYAIPFRLDQKICDVGILLIVKKDIPCKAFTTDLNADFKGIFCGNRF